MSTNSADRVIVPDYITSANTGD